MSDDATVYFGYTVNSVAVCSLGCCYGHHVVQRRFVESEPSILEDASNAGFPNFRTTLDPYHFSFMPNNEITSLARNIAESLRVDGLLSVPGQETLDEFIQTVLDKVETVGGFDLSTYEDDDDDEDDEDEELTEEELDDRWDDDDDEDDDEETI